MGVVLRNGCECVSVLGAIAGCQDTLKCTSIGSTRCEGRGVRTRDSYQPDLALMCHYNGGGEHRSEAECVPLYAAPRITVCPLTNYALHMSLSRAPLPPTA